MYLQSEHKEYAAAFEVAVIKELTRIRMFELGIMQAEVQKRRGDSGRSVVLGLEKGRYTLSMTRLIEWCMALDVPLDKVLKNAKAEVEKKYPAFVGQL